MAILDHPDLVLHLASRSAKSLVIATICGLIAERALYRAKHAGRNRVEFSMLLLEKKETGIPKSQPV